MLVSVLENRDLRVPLPGPPLTTTCVDVGLLDYIVHPLPEIVMELGHCLWPIVQEFISITGEPHHGITGEKVLALSWDAEQNQLLDHLHVRPPLTTRPTRVRVRFFMGDKPNWPAVVSITQGEVILRQASGEICHKLCPGEASVACKSVVFDVIRGLLHPHLGLCYARLTERPTSQIAVRPNRRRLHDRSTTARLSLSWLFGAHA